MTDRDRFSVTLHYEGLVSRLNSIKTQVTRSRWTVVDWWRAAHSHGEYYFFLNKNHFSIFFLSVLVFLVVAEGAANVSLSLSL